MVRKKGRLSRRPVTSRLVAFEEPVSPQNLAGPDSILIELARRMRLAERALHDAMDDLAVAEQRFAALPIEARQSDPRPGWLLAAQEKEVRAGDALESIFQQIAQTPAHTKLGLGIKVQLMGILYGESIDEEENDGDLILLLLGSLLTDLGRA